MKRLIRIFVAAAIIASTGCRSVRAADGITSVPNEDNKIALTFDDGPHPVYTEQILKILDEYGIKATFFVIGENAERYPELIRHEIAAGHELGNHTYTHPHMRNTDEKSLSLELRKTEKLLREGFGIKPVLFRPPEGFCCKTVKSCAGLMSYDIVLWDIDTTDWAHNSVDNIVKTVVSSAKTGDIILCHDYVTKPSPTPQALKKFIPRLLAKGYKFVTVSDLISSEGV